MTPPERVFEAIDRNREEHVEELLEFLRIPSVSTLSENAGDIRRAAEWCLKRMQRAGLRASVLETRGHPVVLGERCPHPGRPTVLVYGHYDVQPPDPLDEWVTPPFSPSVKDGYVYARGATDDKGQLLTYLMAVNDILACQGEIPVNVKILVEGEEEIGSPHLEPFLEANRERLAADVVAVSDGSQLDADTPAITCGIRGMAYMQINVEGPRFDLHSGAFGGNVANPAQVLAWILAALKKRDGTVAVPGFYDEVVEPDAARRREMSELPFDEDGVKAYLGVEQLVGEEGYSPLERKGMRPTLDVNGIWGGFSGEGAKTVIPARAGAKVSMRLVPNQRSSVVADRFREFVLSMGFPGVRVSVQELAGAEPVLVPRDLPSVRAAVRAIEKGFGRPPVFIREGGSIPVVSQFKEILGLDTLLMGWGSPDDGAHSPNERFRLEDFHRGTCSVAAFLYELAS